MMDPFLIGTFGHYPEQFTGYPNTGENMSEFGRLSARIVEIERALDSADRRKRQRDKLAEQLEEIEDKVDEALFERRHREEMPEPENLSLKERLEAFLHWRDQLQIFYSAIERSLQLMKRQGAPREELRRLREIKEDTSEYLYQSDWLCEAAQEKLQDLRNDNDLAAYSQQTSPNRRRHGLGECASTSRWNVNRSGDRSRMGARLQSFSGILDEAEKIRTVSQEASLRMENEVEALKNKSSSMAKEIVDLHKVLEHQKQQLVDVTRMKRENERERKYEL